MKTVITTLVLAVLMLNTPIAVSAENQTRKSSTGTPAAMGMMDDKQMVQMQDNLKRMQQQMDTLRQTKSPNDRQRLIQEHMQSMQANMQMMRGMGGAMMGGAMMGGAMMGGQSGGMGMGQGAMGGSPMRNMDPMQRQDMMEKRMDMMQMMMEQMVQHDQVMQGMPTK